MNVVDQLWPAAADAWPSRSMLERVGVDSVRQAVRQKHLIVSLRAVRLSIGSALRPEPSGLSGRSRQLHRQRAKLPYPTSVTAPGAHSSIAVSVRVASIQVVEIPDGALWAG